MEEKKTFKTYEQIAVDKLKEIEPATRREWSIALNDDYYVIDKLAIRCEKLQLVVVDKRKKPYRYRVNEDGRK